MSEIFDLARPSRYPVRVSGNALSSRGILSGDVLIADAAFPPAHGKVAVVMLQGSVLVGQLACRGGQWWLQSGRVDVQAVTGDEAEVFFHRRVRVGTNFS